MRGVKGYLILIIAACLLMQPLSAVCPYCTTTPVSTQVSVSSSPQVTIDILDLNGQFVKITNNGQDVANLNVWSLKNQDSSLKFVFPHFLLNGGSSVLVYAGNGIDSNTALYTHNMFDAWNTNGDTAYLYDSQGNLISKKTQGSIAPPTPTPTSTVKPSISPIAYYSFDDGTAKDSSGNNFDGSIIGATEIAGVRGKALYFRGREDSHVDLPIILTKTPEQITLMAWIKPESSFNKQIILMNGHNPCYLAINYDELGVQTVNALISLNTGKSSSNIWRKSTYPTYFDGKTWQHLAFTYDSSNHLLCLFLDGKLVQRTDIPEESLSYDSQFYPRAGGPNWWYYSIYNFKGGIDEVQFYDTAISPDEVMKIFNNYSVNPIPTPTPTPKPTTKPTVVPTTSVPTTVPTITPQPTGSSIKAAFSASPQSGSLPLSVSFTDLSTGNPKTWSWSFGDGSYSNEKNPVYTYSEPGSYTVSLKVTGSGVSSSSEKYGYIVVYDPSNPPTFIPTQIPTPTPTQTTVPTAVPTTPITAAPTVTPTVTSGKLVADFTSNVRSGGLPLEVSFRDTSSGSPNKWFWSFGDGTYSEEKNPVHTYADQLSYSVSLEVKKDGNTATVMKGNWITVS